MDQVRVWTEIDIKDIEEHLLIFDDLFGFCPSCKKTGIKYENIEKCPECGKTIKYAACRENPRSPKGLIILTKIRKNLPKVTIIDYDDYKHLSDKKKANDIFGNLNKQ